MSAKIETLYCAHAVYILSAAGVQQQRHERGGTGTGAVVGEQRVLKLILANHELREFHVQLVLRAEDLDILGHVRREVLHRPRSETKRLMGVYHLSVVILVGL